MDGTTSLRRQAWAGLVDEVAARPPTAGDVVAVLRNNPAFVRRTREARASAGMARQALARVCAAVEARPPRDPVQAELLRAWVGLVDDILKMTERLCTGLAAA